METAVPPPLLAGIRPVHWRSLDALVALAYAALAVIVLVNEAAAGWAALVVPLGVVVLAAPVAIRRAHPVAAVLLLIAGAAFLGVVEPQAVPLALAALAYVLYAVASQCPVSVSVPVLIAGLATSGATALPDFQHRGGFLFFAPVLVVIWTVGVAVGNHRRHTRELLDYQSRLAAAELSRTRSRVDQQRVEIARELHDVVAHGLSVITVQAAFGKLVLDRDPVAARDALDAVETSGRQLLAEMRGVLASLRATSGPHTQTDARPDNRTAPIRPNPGLADLDVLVQQSAPAGLAVTVSSSGTSRPLAQGADLAAYRIVQEALANVIRHAQSSEARVLLRYGAEALDLEVSDDGVGCPDGRVDAGHGIVGMHERAVLHGGSLTATAGVGGGFRVRCRLPLPVDEVDPGPRGRASSLT